MIATALIILPHNPVINVYLLNSTSDQYGTAPKMRIKKFITISPENVKVEGLNPILLLKRCLVSKMLKQTKNWVKNAKTIAIHAGNNFYEVDTNFESLIWASPIHIVHAAISMIPKIWL